MMGDGFFILFFSSFQEFYLEPLFPDAFVLSMETCLFVGVPHRASFLNSWSNYEPSKSYV